MLQSVAHPVAYEAATLANHSFTASILGEKNKYNQPTKSEQRNLAGSRIADAHPPLQLRPSLHSSTL